MVDGANQQIDRHEEEEDLLLCNLHINHLPVSVAAASQHGGGVSAHAHLLLHPCTDEL